MSISLSRIPALKKNPGLNHRGPRIVGKEISYVITAGTCTLIRHKTSIGIPFHSRPQINGRAILE